MTVNLKKETDGRKSDNYSCQSRKNRRKIFRSSKNKNVFNKIKIRLYDQLKLIVRGKK